MAGVDQRRAGSEEIKQRPSMPRVDGSDNERRRVSGITTDAWKEEDGMGQTLPSATSVHAGTNIAAPIW